MLAHDLDLNIWQALDAAATKPFGYHRFNPGPGVGGHCLPIDPAYLSWKVERFLGRRFRFADLASDVNARMPDYVVTRLIDGFNRRGRLLRGARILLLGLAYKPNTADTRETPTVPIARRLHGLGAHVRIADPHVPTDAPLPDADRVDADPAELVAADAVVLLTDHDAFDYRAVAVHARHVLDCRRRLGAAPHIETL
jgi:UDP-N-acetyl-D-glucosamine dehydrogenase